MEKELEALEFIQAERTGWITKLNVEDLVGLLPPRPPEQLGLFTDTNRPVSEPHLRGIVQFLESTANWALPGIILAAAPGAARTTRKGCIRVDSGNLRILDGQHRAQAISEALRNGEIAAQQGRESPGRLNDLRNSEIPVMIFEVADVREQQQMFAWFARSKPIETATREWFDHEDPFNNAAKVAMGETRTLRGRVEHKKASTNKPGEDRHLMTLGELKGIAAVIAIGVKRNARDQDREIYRDGARQSELQDHLAKFFDEFLPECGEAYENLLEDDREKDLIHFRRRETYHLFPQAVRLFANCWARTERDRNLPTENLARSISGLNLNRANPENDFRTTLGVMQGDKEKFLRPNDGAWERATSQVMRGMEP